MIINPWYIGLNINNIPRLSSSLRNTTIVMIIDSLYIGISIKNKPMIASSNQYSFILMILCPWYNRLSIYNKPRSVPLTSTFMKKWWFIFHDTSVLAIAIRQGQLLQAIDTTMVMIIDSQYIRLSTNNKPMTASSNQYSFILMITNPWYIGQNINITPRSSSSRHKYHNIDDYWFIIHWDKH